MLMVWIVTRDYIRGTPWRKMTVTLLSYKYLFLFIFLLLILFLSFFLVPLSSWCYLFQIRVSILHKKRTLFACISRSLDEKGKDSKTKGIRHNQNKSCIYQNRNSTLHLAPVSGYHNVHVCTLMYSYIYTHTHVLSFI